MVFWFEEEGVEGWSCSSGVSSIVRSIRASREGPCLLWCVFWRSSSSSSSASSACSFSFVFSLLSLFFFSFLSLLSFLSFLDFFLDLECLFSASPSPLEFSSD